MAPEKTHIVHLLARYKQGNCTKNELRQLQRYLSNDRYNHEFEEALSMSLLEAGNEHLLKEDKLQYLYRSIATKTTEVEVRRNRLSVWSYVAAASVLLTIAVSFFFYERHSGEADIPIDLVSEANVAPGGNRATLTLADGRVLTLSEQQHGIVMSDQIQYEDGASVPGTPEGTGAATDGPPETVSYTLATPRGGTYQLTLPDGTKVWLNAESALTYPERFAEGERVVTLEGEGYFVVAQDARRVFKVISKGQEVEVLGTEFNVSAYPDAAGTSTTLVQGRVRVISANGDTPHMPEVLLNPGQRAENSGGAEIAVRRVNVASYVAWKEGIFYFDETTLTDAMDQLSRWYDLEVSYQDPVPQTHFYGEISRNKTLKEVLAILQEGGIRFRIEKDEGRNKVVVLSR